MKTLTGKCHCGAVEFEVDLERGIEAEQLRRCNCSLCRRKGAVMAFAAKENLRVTKGADNLELYQWNTKIAEHYFCRTCGIYTHHGRRSDPTQFGINLGCVDGVDPLSFESIEVLDGASLSLEQMEEA